jgi:predicted transcriptional regulator
MNGKNSKEDSLIIERLDRLIRIIALTSMKNLTSTEKIGILSQAGFAPKEIAELLGTSQNVVNVRLSELRKARTPEKSKKLQEKTAEEDSS